MESKDVKVQAVRLYFYVMDYKSGKFYRVPCLIRINKRPLKYQQNFINKSIKELNELNTHYLFTPIRKKSIVRGYYILDSRFFNVSQNHLPKNYMIEYSKHPFIDDYDDVGYIYLKCGNNETIDRHF